MRCGTRQFAGGTVRPMPAAAGFESRPEPGATVADGEAFTPLPMLRGRVQLFGLPHRARDGLRRHGRGIRRRARGERPPRRAEGAEPPDRFG